MATLSLSSRLRTPLPPAAMMSSSSSIVSSIGCRRSNSFLGLKGLGIQSPLKSASASLSSKGPKVSPKEARIVCEAQETAIDIPTVNDTTWQSLVLQAEGPVLVEFWAPWCGPCKMILPILGELAQQYTGKLKCFKLNTDECRSTATKYGIRSIPTTIIFVNGKKKDAIIGAVPKSTLIATVEKFL